MKRNPITLIVGGILTLIFALMLFTFQIRQTEVGVVTTFGKYSGGITHAGLYMRWPWPIQQVYKFDNRIQNFERKFDETTTKDAINVLIMVYAGWQIADPRTYLERLNGDAAKASQALETLIRTVKTGVVGQHNFGEMISTNQAQLKFDQIEQEMLSGIQTLARSTYGIAVKFVAIKQLGLPESITARVFDRMRAERQTRIAQFQSDGEKEAQIIRAQADSLVNKTLDEARASAIEINGAAEAKASAYYKVLDQNPELAIFLFQRNALEQSSKERTTLILDQQTPPFNMLNGLSITQSVAQPTPSPDK